MDEKGGVEITPVLSANAETGAGSVAVVTFKSASISRLEEVAVASKQIKKFIDESHPNKLIFDFDGVKFFSSPVLGLLLEIRAKVQTYNGEVVISAINPQLHRVFKITNLDKIFRFFADKESAVKTTSTDAPPLSGG
jgi:anti-sigma B factor antagonist